MGNLLVRHPYYQIEWADLPVAQRHFLSEAADRWCRANLYLGDRLFFAQCGGRTRGIFKGWDGRWIMTATRYDVAPINVLRVNGRDVDPAGLARYLGTPFNS